MYAKSLYCGVYFCPFLLTELVLAVNVSKQQLGTADQHSNWQPDGGM